MSKTPRVILSAFADEAANRKTAVEQLSVLAALGLSYYSPRFVDVEGAGRIKHVVELTNRELKRLAGLHAEYGMQVTSIGSRIGKVKLFDVDDGTHNKYVSPEKYLKAEVAATIDTALALGARLIRGFSFYHPQTDEPEAHLSHAVDRLGPIVEVCARSGLVYGLEVEANLVGQNGRLLAQLVRHVGSPHMVCVFDGGNLSTQNLSQPECFAEYKAMRPYIGWMHVKDYRVDPKLRWSGVVDEERLWNFVPASEGDTGHEAILRDFRQFLPTLHRRMTGLGAPGVFLDLEPHLKGGGQFGGFSGPDGMGVALRALCSLLDYVEIDYDLRSFDEVRRSRGR